MWVLQNQYYWANNYWASTIESVVSEHFTKFYSWIVFDTHTHMCVNLDSDIETIKESQVLLNQFFLIT